MSILDRVKYAFKRAIGRRVEKEIDKEVDKAVNKAIDGAIKKETEKSEATETVSATKDGVNAVEETQNAQAEILNNQAELLKAMSEMQKNAAVNGSSLKDVNEMMSYFEFDKEMNIVGVKENAPEYLKIAYENGEFNK